MAADHFILDANNVGVPCRYAPTLEDSSVSSLQIGLAAAPTALELDFVRALERCAALLEAERARWKTSCVVRRLAADHAFYCYEVVRLFRLATTYEERGFAAHYMLWARRVWHRRAADAPYVALGAVKTKAGAPSAAARAHALAAALDEAFAARAAAYPPARVEALKPVFQCR
jgi:hypothetical protein